MLMRRVCLDLSVIYYLKLESHVDRLSRCLSRLSLSCLTGAVAASESIPVIGVGLQYRCDCLTCGAEGRDAGGEGQGLQSRM